MGLSVEIKTTSLSRTGRWREWLSFAFDWFIMERDNDWYEAL